MNKTSADEAMSRNRSSATNFCWAKVCALCREYMRWRNRIAALPQSRFVVPGRKRPVEFHYAVLQALPSVRLKEQWRGSLVGSPHREALEQCAARIGGCVNCCTTCGTWRAYYWADVGVAAAGSVSWEMCVLGLPTLLIPVAENQIGAATELARRGLHAYFNQTVQPSRLRKAFWELMLSAMARESSRTVLARYWTRAPNESLQKFSLRTEMVSDDFLS